MLFYGPLKYKQLVRIYYEIKKVWSWKWEFASNGSAYICVFWIQTNQAYIKEFKYMYMHHSAELA